jgi:hypothetical protein
MQLTMQGDVHMPTRSPARTLLRGLEIEITGEESDWRIQPGNIEVLAVKEVSRYFSFRWTTC